MSYSVAIIGCGNIGMLYDGDIESDSVLSHAKAFYKNKAFSLDIMVDKDKEKLKIAKKRFSEVKLLEDYKQVLSKGKPDLLVIAVQTELHFEILKYFQDKNIPLIVCEKPLVENEFQFNEIIKNKRNNIILNYIRRFVPKFIEIRKRIKKGEFGKLEKVVCYYGKGIMNNGSHVIDMVRYLGGEAEVDSISILDKKIDYSENDPTLDLVFKIKNDNKMIYFLGNDERNFSLFEMELFFSSGKIEIKDFGRYINSYKLIDDPDYSGYKQLSLEPEIIDTNLNQNMLFFSEYCEKILSGKEENISDLNNELKNMIFLKKVRELL